MWAVIMLCALLFAASTALAFYHVGVEQHWFAGPTACTGSITGATFGVTVGGTTGTVENHGAITGSGDSP